MTVILVIPAAALISAPLAYQCRFSALYKVTAHDYDNLVLSVFACLTDVIGMSVVKWVIFCNDSNNFHIKKYLPFLKIQILK